ncbi:hypothetical protein NM688_g2527 [Phlebia brevispora]|uniref:Uncharacterized protein n=1 Tax=Phlebia brevispora TaxID=194682 RepID=A0ACC1T8M0_9APHY|nr:hypothetical protein NM688_g2527 [Phlebia brevispora]
MALTISAEPSESGSSEPCATPEEYGRWTGYHPVTTHADAPSPQVGYVIVILSVVFMLVGVYATFLSAFIPKTGWRVLDIIASDSHYKYFIVLLVPTTAYFVIANWVGWQYYQNS